MSRNYTKAPSPLPTTGPLGEYNDCLARVKEQIRIMANNHATLQWLNEVQRLINTARQNALETDHLDTGREYYDD
jgi:hypothetical protein